LRGDNGCLAQSFDHLALVPIQDFDREAVKVAERP
jgi:hypothetical protein